MVFKSTPLTILTAISTALGKSSGYSLILAISIDERRSPVPVKVVWSLLIIFGISTLILDLIPSLFWLPNNYRIPSYSFKLLDVITTISGPSSCKASIV